MQINTEIGAVTVSIEGTDYAVAMKTIDIAERLIEAEESYAAFSVMPKAQYELWLSKLRIVLGDDAVDRLFTNGRDENLDRMEAIYVGVMSAFDSNGSEIRKEHSDKR